MEADDPPRKVYGFKEREFKRDNPSSAELPPAPTAKDLAMMAGPGASGSKGHTGPRKDDPNDVHALMAQNREAEKRHGLDFVEIREVKSRRARDYWLLLIFGNLAIIGAVYFSGMNIVSLLFGLAGVIMFSLSVTWIMWQIMGRY